MKPIDELPSSLFDIGYINKDQQILSARGEEITLSELQEIAQKQQHQIEIQQKALVGKEQRLRYLKQQMLHQRATTADNEKLRRLRVAADAQEVKISEFAALKEKVEEKRNENVSLSTEYEVVRSLYDKKQEEYSASMLKVQELTNKLDEIRNGYMDNEINYSGNLTVMEKNQQNQLERLRKEMVALNHMKDAQEKHLNERKAYLAKCNDETATMDRQIEELTYRLQQKRILNGSTLKDDQALKNPTNAPVTRMHTIVAAVEPLIQQTEPNISNPPLKNSSTSVMKAWSSSHPIPMNRDVPDRSNNSLPRNVTPGRTGQRLAGQHALLSLLDNRNNQQKVRDNREFYNKAMPHPKKEPPRPQSAMAQLFSEPLSPKQDSLTAKVRPILSKSSASSISAEASHDRPSASSPSTNYYSLNTKDTPSDSPVNSPSLGTANLFAYRPPPPIQSKSIRSQVKSPKEPVLPSENSKYPHPPPPYPTSGPASSSTNHLSSASPETRDSFSERSFTVDIEALRRKFAHAPRPLKKRSSFSEPERPQGPVIPKLIYDQIYKKADTPFYRPTNEEPPFYRPTNEEQERRLTPPPAYVAPEPGTTGTEKTSGYEKTISNIPGNVVSYERNVTPTQFMRQQNAVQGRFKPNKVATSLSPPPMPVNHDTRSIRVEVTPPEFPSSPASPLPSMPSLHARPTKGIIRRPREASKRSGTRIRFDPLALLLDASLEGEFDLVMRIVDKVPDSSQANDEGITALHNAVCAGHFDLVKFLVHYGSDVNASDTDGWTPLHCSASCNNMAMCRFLVENGACVFAATLSDRETAADKCEELDEHFVTCSEYLYAVQEKLGVIRQGQVYALFDYEAQNNDELSFHDGDLMIVLRRGDNLEREWWWARLNGKEGYIPRNLLGMWPRIKKPNRDGHE